MTIRIIETRGLKGDIQNKIPPENVSYLSGTNGRNFIGKDGRLQTMLGDIQVGDILSKIKTHKNHNDIHFASTDSALYYLNDSDAWVKISDIQDYAVFQEYDTIYGKKLLAITESTTYLLDSYSLPSYLEFPTPQNTKLVKLYKNRLVYAKNNGVFGSFVYEDSSDRQTTSTITISSNLSSDYSTTITSTSSEYIADIVLKTQFTTSSISVSDNVLTLNGDHSTKLTDIKTLELRGADDLVAEINILSTSVNAEGNTEIIFSTSDDVSGTFTSAFIIQQDDNKGNIGSGTINYLTGAFAYDFGFTPTSLEFEYVKVNESTGGILDISFTTDRVSGEGFVLYINDLIKSMGVYNDTLYVFGQDATVVKTSDDDSTISSQIYRKNVFVQNNNAVVETSKGLYFVYENNKEKFLNKLSYSETNDIIDVDRVAENFDWAKYDYENTHAVVWGRYILVSGKEDDIHEENDTIMIYDTREDSVFIDKSLSSFLSTDSNNIYSISSTTDSLYRKYSGQIDSINDTLFCSWESSLTNLGTHNLHKKIFGFQVSGRTYGDIILTVSVRYDKGGYEEIGRYDLSRVGNSGSEVGGMEFGESNIGFDYTDYEELSDYSVNIYTPPREFERRQVKFDVSGTGILEIEAFKDRDIRILQDIRGQESEKKNN